MGIYISFGKYNTNYKFIILTGFFMTCKYYIPHLLIAIFLKKEIINEYTAKLFDHEHMIENFRLIGMLIFSIIFYIYEIKSSKSESNIEKSDTSNSPNSDKGCFGVIKDDDERKKKLKESKNHSNLYIIIIVIICVIIEFFSEIISPLSFFTYWMVVLLIISYINKKMFKREIYKHQKLAIYFSFIVAFIFQLSSFILSMKSEEVIDRNIYKQYLNLWFLPIGLTIHFVYVSLNSIIYSKMKWLMDSKNISLGKLFMIYSIAALIFNIIICIVLTHIKCSTDVAQYFCEIEDEDDLYLENISLFIEDILVINENFKKDLIYVIIIIFVDMITYSLYIFFFLSILKNLALEYYFFLSSITGVFSQIILMIKNKISFGYFFASEGKDFKLLLTKFLFNIIGNSLAVIGFLVYLEIIELNFFNLNYNLRRKIMERSIIESIERTSINTDSNESLIDENNTSNTELSNKDINQE